MHKYAEIVKENIFQKMLFYLSHFYNIGFYLYICYWDQAHSGYDIDQ